MSNYYNSGYESLNKKSSVDLARRLSFARSRSTYHRTVVLQCKRCESLKFLNLFAPNWECSLHVKMFISLKLAARHRIIVAAVGNPKTLFRISRLFAHIERQTHQTEINSERARVRNKGSIRTLNCIRHIHEIKTNVYVECLSFNCSVATCFSRLEIWHALSCACNTVDMLLLFASLLCCQILCCEWTDAFDAKPSKIRVLERMRFTFYLFDYYSGGNDLEI